MKSCETLYFEQCLTQNHCDLQHFIGKNVFLEKKAHFFGNKTVDQRSGANLKKRVFCKNLLQISCFFSFFAEKMLKMNISTSVWCVQNPNAGQNIQHLTYLVLGRWAILDC